MRKRSKISKTDRGASVRERFFPSIAIFLIIVLACFGPPYLTYTLFAGLFALSAWELFLMSFPHTRESIHNRALDSRLRGNDICIYVSYLLFICLALLSALQLYSTRWLFYVFMVTWMHDVGGYVFGRWLRGPKIMPTISPNKTWSGLAGGIACGILWSQVALILNYPAVSWTTVVVANICGLLGDMLESKIKRYYNVKDSGNWIPGHGGVLDRFDSFWMISLFFVSRQQACQVKFHSIIFEILVAVVCTTMLIIICNPKVKFPYAFKRTTKQNT